MDTTNTTIITTNQQAASQQSQQISFQHFNFQTNSIKINNNKFTSDENTNLDAFLESPQFLTDPYIKSLIDKGITLGIVWEVIKETLSRFLLICFNSSEFDLNSINYARLIDEEKFFEQLILHSIQVESTNNSKHAHSMTNTNDDCNENDDDEYESTTTNESAGIEHPVLVSNSTEHDFDLGNSQFNRLNNLTNEQKTVNRPVTANSNLMSVKKSLPLTAQQKLQQEQDYITQSINRINDKSNLRPIIVDSNDVALSSHSNKQVFMFSRIKQVVDYFEKRNHQIYVILSSWRKEQIMATALGTTNTTQNASATSSSSSIINSQSQNSANTNTQSQMTQLTPDQLALIEMEQKNYIYYTPSKRVGAKRIVCDDDSYMLKLAVAKCAIIVSNDNFKRFLNHSDDFKLVIEERVLMYSFIDNTFMPAEDPLGKNGPSLDNFLRFESFVNQQYMKRCPYRKKCTYGSKCKFWHPERGLHQGNQLFKTAHQSVLDEAQEQKMRLEIILNKNSYSANNLLTNKIASQQQQSIYNIDSTNNDLLDNNNDEDTTLNRLKQQKQQYSGLITPTNIYNLNEFETLKNTEQTWGLNKADSDLTFMNKNNQSQHIATQFQKMSLFGDKLQDTSRGLNELRAMGPDTTLKMSSLNQNNANAAKNLQQKLLTQNSSLNKSQSSFNTNSSCYTPNLLWANTVNNNKSKNDFDFDSLNHQTGVIVQQQYSSLDNSRNSLINDLNDSNKKQLLTKKLNEKTDLTEPFSLFAPSTSSSTTTQTQTQSQTNTNSSSTPASVSPPLNSNNSLRAQLIAQNLNPKLVDDVLAKYKGETDIDKLIFLARGISFSSDF